MNSSDRVCVWLVALGVALFIGMFTVISIAEVNDKAYRVEALKATQDCEPCKLIILTGAS